MMRRQKKERIVASWVSLVVGLLLALLIWKMNPQADGSGWPAITPFDRTDVASSQDQAPPPLAVKARSGSPTRPSPTVLTEEMLAAAGKLEAEWLEAPSDIEPSALDVLEVSGNGISFDAQEASVLPGYSTWSAWRGASGGYGFGGGGGGGGIGSPRQGAAGGSSPEETASRARVGGSSPSGTPESGAVAAVSGSPATESSTGGSPNLSQLPPQVEKLLAAVGPFETVVQAASPSEESTGGVADLLTNLAAPQGFDIPGDSLSFAALVPEQPRLNPEPATLLLLGTGLAWTARQMRRARNRANKARAA